MIRVNGIGLQAYVATFIDNPNPPPGLSTRNTGLVGWLRGNLQPGKDYTPRSIHALVSQRFRSDLTIRQICIAIDHLKRNGHLQGQIINIGATGEAPKGRTSILQVKVPA